MRKLFLILLLLVITVEVGFLLSKKVTLSNETSLTQYADRVLAQCSFDIYRPACYDKEIPRLMDEISMEEAFGVTELVLEKDSSYFHCHVLGHKLSGRETAKDPKKWKEVVTRCPPGICNNGCLHGPLLERYKSEQLTDGEIDQLKPDLVDVCDPRGDWQPTMVERSMCHHGLGHLGMYITGADIKKSLEICDLIGRKVDGHDFTATCYQGVFMQVYQGIEPEDFALVSKIKPSRDQVVSFCAKYIGEAWEACRNEAWALFNREILSPDFAAKFCSYSSNLSSQEKCMAPVMNHITVKLVIDQNSFDMLREFCLGLPGKYHSICFAFAARRLVQIDYKLTDKAVGICVLAADNDVGDECYKELVRYSSYSFHSGSKEFINYCQSLSDPWDQKCLNQS